MGFPFISGTVLGTHCSSQTSAKKPLKKKKREGEFDSYKDDGVQASKIQPN